MQLKKIKLAGFKSFVDPTTVLVPSKLVAVVGPNGCGKSNIIDAVCWVMGESSAKYLRGESLTDVIFNGSSARKPVGQASVELIFDNQDGSLGGAYASYAEVSIRRVITRDSDSHYYLNGTRCRRRDIIDIFLGTGLGPRSYSIIGQNMISRIIEAKPDEMRIYLEEAAGVSKYKDRRRETENRMNHTKENLARLNDVRAELEKQLNSLKRQAAAAEKYKSLKQQERELRAQCLVIQWRQLDRHLIQSTLEIQQHETGIEAHQANLSQLNLQLDEKRIVQGDLTELFQDVQRRYYAASNDINRIEQDLKHTKERQHQWEIDIAQVEGDWHDAKNNLTEVEFNLEELSKENHQLEPECKASKELVTRFSQLVSDSEIAMQTWQNQWDEFNQHQAKLTRTAEVEQMRIRHFEERLTSLQSRQIKLVEEQKQIDFSQLDKNIIELTEQLADINALTENQGNEITTIRNAIQASQMAQQNYAQELDQIRNELQKLRGRQSALEALQQTALGKRNQDVIHWLTEHQLNNYPRLAQELTVEKGWEEVVEKVLGFNLQAICINQLSDVFSVIDDFREGRLCVFSPTLSQTITTSKGNTLQSKVTSRLPLDSLLGNIYITENQTEAYALCSSLEPHESVVTRDGVWMNAHWIRILRDENPEKGVFQREQELKQINQQINECLVTQEKIEKNNTEYKDQLKVLETKRDQLQKLMQQSQAKSAEMHAQQKAHKERLAELKIRAERFIDEQKEIQDELQKNQQGLTDSRALWQNAMAELEKNANERLLLTENKDQLRTELNECREKLNRERERSHQFEVRLQTTQSQLTSLRQTLERLNKQLITLTERKTILQKELASIPLLSTLEQSLEEALKRRLKVEEELYTARTNVESAEQEVQEFEKERQAIENEIIKYRNLLESLRVEWQGHKVKSDTVSEQIKEMGFSLESLLQQLSEEENGEDKKAALTEVSERIGRLGAINLVAIEEYSVCSERKEYLDKQVADLEESLQTLENAIAKIDKETRSRFKETFDKVNEQFQELFPQIFGGGRAYLELTSDNFLDAGITVMACPPGKRNSTIHLLSGGEKAMTAIALVFSIFRLNPAPFCLLDEVDAPLDDANIGRFCQLVKTMSRNTQFIFISHNKLAIEMGEHLMGVTMHEPGVSRLVSVNVEEAVSMAGA